MRRGIMGVMPDTEAPPAPETKPAETDPKEPEAKEPEAGESDEDAKARVKRLEGAVANERKRWEKAERELSELRKSQMSEQERAVAEAKAVGRSEALNEVAAELLKAEVRAQAAAKLADPADAVRLLDLDGMLSEDGRFDPKAVGDALDDLVKAKPYLVKANGAPAPKAPQGARDGAKPAEGDDFIRTLAKNIRGG